MPDAHDSVAQGNRILGRGLKLWTVDSCLLSKGNTEKCQGTADLKSANEQV